MHREKGRFVASFMEGSQEEVVAAMKEHLRSFNKASKFCKENSIEEPEEDEIGRVEDAKSGTQFMFKKTSLLSL